MWKLTPFRDEVQLLSSLDLLGQMYEIAKRRSKEELKLIVALWWVAWYARNQFVFEMKTLDPERAAAKAEAVVEAYTRVKMHKVKMAAGSEIDRNSSWLPPPEGKFKVNVNAAINKGTRQGGLGAVIRDQNGRVLATAVKKIKFNGDVAQIEAAAINLGIQVAKDAGWTPLTV